MELVTPTFDANDGDEGRASASDREMIETTVAGLELIGAKWKVDVLYLLAARVRRHGRLRNHLLVSKKVLSDTLKGLERDGLVCRSVFPDTPPRVEYSLTPLGRSLTAPLLALSEWSEEHLEEVLAARAAYDRSTGRSSDTPAPSPRFTVEFQVQRDPEPARWLDAA
jgi:DNA-binding HxlR family transcriptional regulator